MPEKLALLALLVGVCALASRNLARPFGLVGRGAGRWTLRGAVVVAKVPLKSAKGAASNAYAVASDEAKRWFGLGVNLLLLLGITWLVARYADLLPHDLRLIVVLLVILLDLLLFSAMVGAFRASVRNRASAVYARQARKETREVLGWIKTDLPAHLQGVQSAIGTRLQGGADVFGPLRRDEHPITKEQRRLAKEAEAAAADLMMGQPGPLASEPRFQGVGPVKRHLGSRWSAFLDGLLRRRGDQ